MYGTMVFLMLQVKQWRNLYHLYIIVFGLTRSTRTEPLTSYTESATN